jgi:ATP-binding cassette subfamily F protein 3
MLEIIDLTKRFGARAVLDRASMRVPDDARVGLVGRNGEGKSTLLRIVAGLDVSEDGRIVMRRGARVGYLEQEVDALGTQSVIDEVRTAQAPLLALEAQVRELEHQIAARGESGHAPPEALAQRYVDLHRELEVSGGFDADVALHRMLIGLGLGRDTWDKPLCALSGGWLMRVELAKLLLAQPEVLLLDEPTNHLDLTSIAWLEGVLRTYPGAVLVVSHDRAFLDRHVTHIAELEGGRLTVYRGGYSAYVEQRNRRLEEAETRRRALERQIAHARTFVERFGAKATKARQAESRKKQIERWSAERDALPTEAVRRTLRLTFPEAPRPGDVVVRLEGVCKSFSEKCVYRDLDLEVRRDDRVALVGPNGAGKTTLLRIIAGALAPDRGTRELGHNVRLAYFTQHQVESLDPSRTVLEEIEHGAPFEWVPRLRSLLGAFLFSGDDVYKRVSVLSGGERARLALAKLLLEGANFLVLDEPTNHLDIPSIDMVTSALQSFGGCLLLISHDRGLVNALANRVLVVEPRDGDAGARVELLRMRYDEYMGEPVPRGRAAEPAAPAPGAPRATAGSGTAPAASNVASGATPDRRAAKRSKNAERRLREESEAVQEQIMETETRIGQIDQLLAHPTVARDGDRLRELALERSEQQSQLAELYTRWEALEEALRDE